MEKKLKLSRYRSVMETPPVWEIVQIPGLSVLGYPGRKWMVAPTPDLHYLDAVAYMEPEEWEELIIASGFKDQSEYLRAWALADRMVSQIFSSRREALQAIQAAVLTLEVSEHSE